jgi:hypothetical protein
MPASSHPRRVHLQEDIRVLFPRLRTNQARVLGDRAGASPGDGRALWDDPHMQVHGSVDGPADEDAETQRPGDV